MSGGQKFELLAALEIRTLPAAVDALLSAAIPDFTVWRASTTAAGELASQLYQSTEHFIACRIALKDIKERSLRNGLSRFIESSRSKLFSQISCQASYLARVDEAVAAIRPQ